MNHELLQPQPEQQQKGLTEISLDPDIKIETAAPIRDKINIKELMESWNEILRRPMTESEVSEAQVAPLTLRREMLRTPDDPKIIELYIAVGDTWVNFADFQRWLLPALRNIFLHIRLLPYNDSGKAREILEDFEDTINTIGASFTRIIEHSDPNHTRYINANHIMYGKDQYVFNTVKELIRYAEYIIADYQRDVLSLPIAAVSPNARSEDLPVPSKSNEEEK